MNLAHPSPWYWRFDIVMFRFAAAQRRIDEITFLLTYQRLLTWCVLHQPQPEYNPNTTHSAHHIENGFPAEATGKQTSRQHRQHSAECGSRIAEIPTISLKHSNLMLTARLTPAPTLYYVQSVEPKMQA